MALSTVERLTHNERYLSFLRELNRPVVAAAEQMQRALMAYAGAPAAFNEGGQFDATTPGDYLEINQEFAAQFAQMAALMTATFEPPAEALTLPELAQWLLAVIVALDEQEPGIFGGISQEVAV